MLFFWNASYLHTQMKPYPNETQKEAYFLFCFQESEIQKYRVKGFYVNHYENAQLLKTFFKSHLIASVLVRMM